LTAEPDFFKRTVRRTLDDRLAAVGFADGGSGPGPTEYWVRDDGVFFRVGFLKETAPQYELLIGTGIGHDPAGEQKSPLNAVPIWRLISEERARSIASWRFSDERELIDELDRLWVDGIEPCVLPYWRDVPALEREVELEANAARQEASDIENARAVAEARRAFGRGDYATTIRLFESAQSRGLSPSDQRKLDIARRRG
jgi:hypothetical protein